MSALDLNIGLMVLLEDLAKEHYDGHFTIMKLGPVWRGRNLVGSLKGLRMCGMDEAYGRLRAS